MTQEHDFEADDIVPTSCYFCGRGPAHWKHHRPQPEGQEDFSDIEERRQQARDGHVVPPKEVFASLATPENPLRGKLKEIAIEIAQEPEWGKEIGGFDKLVDRLEALFQSTLQEELGKVKKEAYEQGYEDGKHQIREIKLGGPAISSERTKLS